MIGVGVGVAELGAASAGVPPTPLAVSVAFGALTLGLLAVRGMYRSGLTFELLDDIRGVMAVTALAAMVVLSVRALATTDLSVAPQGARLWVFAATYLVAGRVALHWSKSRARRGGELLRPTLIVGSGRVGQLTARRLLAHPEFGLKPIGFLDKDPLPVPDDLPVPVLGASWDLDSAVRAHGVEQVIVCFSTAPTRVLLRLAERSERLGLEVAFVPRLFERMTRELEVHHLGGLPLVFARRPDPHGWGFAVKYTIDRVVAAALIVLVAPAMLASAAAVWITMGRPIFFRQPRVGVDGREFDMLKFRSMHGSPSTAGEADAAWLDRQIGLEGDEAPRSAEDRRTPVGAFLRRASLDELPQLFNVLLGHMSIVGPRPERAAYVRVLEDFVYRYSDRHRVKSGVTGWAQVHGLRGNTSLADRVEWDNYYIENWSLWLDLKILVMTVAAVVRSFRSVE